MKSLKDNNSTKGRKLLGESHNFVAFLWPYYLGESVELSPYLKALITTAETFPKFPNKAEHVPGAVPCLSLSASAQLPIPVCFAIGKKIVTPIVRFVLSLFARKAV